MKFSQNPYWHREVDSSCGFTSILIYDLGLEERNAYNWNKEPRGKSCLVKRWHSLGGIIVEAIQQ